MPRLVRVATLYSFFFHGALILAARYRASYDAYVHMFFADHYRMNWWSLWDERWYTGFPVTSYPPLVHQVIGGLSHLIGLDASFALVLWMVLTLLPLAVYCFSRVFAGNICAGYAALGAAFLPSAYLTAHIFGQLPFLAGTVLALFGAASLARFLEDGGLHNFTLTLALMTSTMAAHHAVLLFQPFLIFAVLLRFLFKHGFNKKSPLSIQVRFFQRLLLVTLAAAVFSLLVIFPFWEWGRTQTIQIPIDHASRHNFLTDPLALLLFFLPMYGPLALLIPMTIHLARKKAFIGLAISFSLLFLLGLGGTTPLPALFFGKGWEWLTYDRFAFWASLFLLPFLGQIVILARRRYSRASSTKIYAALAVSSLIVAMVTVFLPLQPGAVDMGEIVGFLEQDDRSSWRYLTFGFGDQLALLSTLTTATTIDGSYHTARSLTELRSSGIAQIDTALWFPNGLSALNPILQKAGGHGVRWGFVNVPEYDPVLERNGWVKLTRLRGGVQVWENPAAKALSPSNPPPVRLFASFAWGTFPLLSLAMTLSLASLKVFPIQAEKVLRSAYMFLMGLIPLSLCFWYYKTVGEFSHPRVYFTYDHALLFTADILAILAVLLWGCVRISNPASLKSTGEKVRSASSAFHTLPILLLSLSTLSAIWSSDWRTSLYISLHLWLVLLLILSIRDWKEVWRPILLGFCSALVLQIIVGLTIFTMQSTHFLEPLNMKWPGLLTPSVRGASVVQLQDGSRILRAYGTLPHPNILGGFALLCLLGPASLFITSDKTNIPALLLYSLGIVLIMETFSRSAWLGLLCFLFLLWLKSKHLDRLRLYLLFSASILSMLLTLYPLRDLVLTRFGHTSVQTEQLSTFGRTWLNQQALDIFLASPFFGAGTGSFILQLAGYTIQGAPIEPVHNMFLLIGAELGIFGLLIAAAILFRIVVRICRVHTVQAILVSATLAGIGVISLFDHYFWSIAPGRLMLGLAFGLWAGQVVDHDA